MKALINIDVPDLARGEAFYVAGPQGRAYDRHFSDPFGHGFCLLQFSHHGYDAIAT